MDGNAGYAFPRFLFFFLTYFVSFISMAAFSFLIFGIFLEVFICREGIDNLSPALILDKVPKRHQSTGKEHMTKIDRPRNLFTLKPMRNGNAWNFKGIFKNALVSWNLRIDCKQNFSYVFTKFYLQLILTLCVLNIRRGVLAKSASSLMCRPETIACPRSVSWPQHVS